MFMPICLPVCLSVCLQSFFFQIAALPTDFGTHDLCDNMQKNCGNFAFKIFSQIFKIEHRSYLGL